MKNWYWLSIVSLLTVVGLFGAHGVAPEHQAREVDWSQRDKSLAFGVNPFLTPRPQTIKGTARYFRLDFASQLIAPGNWSEISHVAGEYEMYIELLQGAGAFPAELNLADLAATLNGQNMMITFQVGGPGPMNGKCSGSGLAAAQKDIGLLKTWQRVNGRIDKIITDNSFAKYYGSANPICYSNPDQLMHLVASELADYFMVMSQAFPGVRFGVTDGFGQFKIIDPNGARGNGSITYNATVHMPEFDFQIYMTDIAESMRNKGLFLDEFVMDCAEAYASDASQYPNSRYIDGTRNYGRIIAGEKIMEAMKIGAGVYWDAFPGYPIGSSMPVEEKQYHDLVLQQVRAFYNFGGHPRHNRFTFWTGVPDVTGPETTANTALNDIRDAVRAVATLDFRP